MENQTSTEIVKIEPQQPVSFFLNKEAFEHSQRVAKMLADSDLVPTTFKGKVGNCVIALNMASRIGADPMMVMQNLYVVHGKPAWSSKFLIATLNASGKFSPLRYEEDENTDGGRTRAWANDRTGQPCYGAWVSMEMAQKEGWINKSGSKWQTMPEVMRRYRAASFFVNQFAPEISMGIHTQEEVQDIGYPEEVKADTAATSDKVKSATDDLQRIQRNQKIRQEIEKKEKEQEGLQPDSDKYMTLQNEIEELESQIQK